MNLLESYIKLVTARACLHEQEVDGTEEVLRDSACWRIDAVMNEIRKEMEKGGTDEEKSMSEELPYKSQEAGGCKVIQFED